jgi:hypothetical protein
MLLSARPLVDLAGPNSFEPATQWLMTEGDSTTLAMQLLDGSLDRPDQGFMPSGRRYIPDPYATLVVMIENIDDNRKVQRLATQPYPQDGSIWTVTILSTDPIRGSPQVRLTLTEGTKVTRGLLRCVLKVGPSGSCC